MKRKLIDWYWSMDPASALVAVVVCALVIDPARLRAAADPTYAEYPDHEGAARFVESLHPGPHDIVVAEDALMQTYYLGHVDYWLQDEAMAAPYLHRVDGRCQLRILRHQVDELAEEVAVGKSSRLGSYFAWL